MKQNPFYSNYIFTDSDLDRMKIKKWQYPLLFFIPTYVQINENYAWHFKYWQGRIYLMKIEKVNKNVS